MAAAEKAVSGNSKMSIRRTRESSVEVIRNARAAARPGQPKIFGPRRPSGSKIKKNPSPWNRSSALPKTVPGASSMPPAKPPEGQPAVAEPSPLKAAHDNQLPGAVANKSRLENTGGRLQAGNQSRNYSPSPRSFSEGEGIGKPLASRQEQSADISKGTDADVEQEPVAQPMSQRQQEQDRVQRLRQAGALSKIGTEEVFTEEEQKAKKNKPHIIFYLPAFGVAIFKDILDWVGLGSLPVIGTVITFACSALIFLMLYFFRANKQLADSRFILRLFLIMVVATLAEFFFGINFLPIETLSVYLVYWIDGHISKKYIAELAEASKSLRKKPAKI